MDTFSQFSLFYQGLAFVSLIFCLVALIALLNVYWRSHKMLRIFTVYFIASIGIFSAGKIIGILGLNSGPSWNNIGLFFDLAQAFFFMLAAVEFYRIIRRLDGEAPPQQK